MKKNELYFYISYHRNDYPIVDKLANHLGHLNVKLWYDIKMMSPGKNWADEIQHALNNAWGLIVFLSKESTKSNYFLDEISYMLKKNAIIIPVLLEKNVKIPDVLSHFQTVDLFGRDAISIEQTSLKIIQEATKAKMLPTKTLVPAKQKSNFKKDESKQIATSIANEKRGKVKPESPATPSSLFIVHGKDNELLDEVETYINGIGIKPIVLTKIAGAEQSLLQKFLTWSMESRFAIVLFSADDFGASRQQFELPKVGERSLQFRARQNVILELGFFYGYLGWENVFVMFKNPDKPFPNFEIPSDLAGVVYDTIDKEGNWKNLIKERLTKAGFEIS